MKKLLFVLIFLFALYALSACRQAGAEQVEIATYYPSPEGVYNELQAQKYYSYPLSPVPHASSPEWYGTDPVGISYLNILSTTGYLTVGVADTTKIRGLLDVSRDNGQTHDFLVHYQTGNIGIGSTEPYPYPADKIYIYGPRDKNANQWVNLVKIENAATDNGGKTLYVVNAIGNNEPLSYFENFGNGPAAVFTGGNVGIGSGAITPDTRLKVSDAIETGKNLVSFHNTQGAGGGRALYARNTEENTDPVAYFERFTNSPTIFGPAAVFVDNSGFNTNLVGIGTANPTATLEVNGTMQVNGTIKSLQWTVHQLLSSETASTWPIYTRVFNTGGGVLVITATGTGYVSAEGSIGMSITIEGNPLPSGEAKVYSTVTGTAGRKVFTNTIIVPGISSGSHRIVLTALSGTRIELNKDFFSVTVLEFPFNN